MSDFANVNFSHFVAGGNITITLNGQTFAPSHKSKKRLTAHPTVFIARREVHAHLIALLTSAISAGRPFALVIRGPRGCGKTTLADDICETIKITAHRLIADAGLEPAQIGIDDLVFVDAFLEKTSKGDAEAWLRQIPAKFFVVTTRRPEGTAAVRSILFQREGTVNEYELGGLTAGEFEQAVQTCQSAPGCEAVRWSKGDAQRLFQATGGLPLAVQLLYSLSGSPIVGIHTFLMLSTLGPEDALAELVTRWRSCIAEENQDLYAALFTMANVPMLGISVDALAGVLDWQAERIVRTISQLWEQGLISQVSPFDAALKLHDAIRDAFLANELEAGRASEQKRRYIAYCQSDSQSNPAPLGAKTSKSRISMVDSMVAASEALFGLARQEYIDAKPVEAYLIFLELKKLQENILHSGCSAQQIDNLARWLCDYVKQNGASLKCNELIAIGGVAQSLPIAMPKLGDSFAPLWELGKELDPTKVTAAMLASIRHWRELSINNAMAVTRRIENAFDRQRWHAFGQNADLVAAGFAAAHAMIDQFGIGASYLSGFRVKEKGISCREGFAVLLLSLDQQKGSAKANDFLHTYGDFCREIDPVTATYLRARGIACSNRYFGSEIEENLNRQALWSVWSDNHTYRGFVAEILKFSTKRSDHPPLFVLSRNALDAAARNIPRPFDVRSLS
jgi:hypothetical protein